MLSHYYPIKNIFLFFFKNSLQVGAKVTKIPVEYKFIP